MTFTQPSDPFGLTESRVDETGIRWSNHTPPRPYIKDPVSGKERLYSRCTSWIDILDDRSALEMWKQRMILAGIALDSELTTRLIQVSVDEELDNKQRLNAIATDAFRAGDGHVKAEQGTNLHRLSEWADVHLVADGDAHLVHWPDPCTSADIADMVAYRNTMERYGFEMLATETRVVIDELKVTGTFDRIVRYQGANYIADLKTGRVDYGALKIASQLAMYSRGCVYDPATGDRKPFRNIDLDKGLVFHLPQGEARCDIYEVDLNLGWEACLLVQQVRDMRKRGAKAMVPLSHWEAT